MKPLNKCPHCGFDGDTGGIIDRCSRCGYTILKPIDIDQLIKDNEHLDSRNRKKNKRIGELHRKLLKLERAVRLYHWIILILVIIIFAMAGNQ